MRRVVPFFLSLIFVMSFAFTSVFAVNESVQAGTVNSAALSYLSSIVYDKPLTDYVIYRVGDYETRLVYGDLSYSSNRIVSDGEVNVVSYNQRGSSSGINSYNATVTSSTYSTFNLSVSSTSLIYSNLGDFASVSRNSTRGEYIHYTIEFLSMAFLFLTFFVFNRGKVHL